MRVSIARVWGQSKTIRTHPKPWDEMLSQTHCFAGSGLDEETAGAVSGVGVLVARGS